MILISPIIPCEHDMSREARILREELLGELTRLCSILERENGDVHKVTKDISIIQLKLGCL